MSIWILLKYAWSLVIFNFQKGQCSFDITAHQDWFLFSKEIVQNLGEFSRQVNIESNEQLTLMNQSQKRLYWSAWPVPSRRESQGMNGTSRYSCISVYFLHSFVAILQRIYNSLNQNFRDRKIAILSTKKKDTKIWSAYFQNILFRKICTFILIE